jgi:hypothetical protein
MNIYYQHLSLNEDQYDLEDFIKYKNNPNWWKRLNIFKNGKKNLMDYISSYGLQGLNSSSHLTAKVCPSFHSVFKNSIILKSPSEIIFEVTQNSINWVTSNPLITIDYHPEDQIPEYLGEKYFFIKFKLPFIFISDKKCSYVIQNPTLYNDVFYEVCPGQIELESNKSINLNVITLVKKPLIGKKEIYTIKAGESLAMLTFSEKINSIKHKKILTAKYSNWNHRKSFIGSWKKNDLQ